MGGGTYSTTNYISNKVRDFGSLYSFTNSSISDNFKNVEINNAMNPYGIIVRESRDSEEHPKSLAIILGLDVTGSMGSVPHYLVKQGLPNIMDGIIQGGVPDPQILFMGIGDHECDSSPLQVGQFESSDELLDKWLTDLYLEGGGGGNYGESYALAWYFAMKHTAIDCFEKRNQKGFLFTVGDEPVLKNIPKNFLKDLMGEGQYQNYSAHELFEKACEKYHVYHIHIKFTASGGRPEVIDGWKQLLNDNLLIAEHKEDVAKLISDTVLKNMIGEVNLPPKEKENTESKTEEMML